MNDPAGAIHTFHQALRKALPKAEAIAAIDAFNEILAVVRQQAAGPSPLSDFLRSKPNENFVYGKFREGSFVVVVGNGYELRSEAFEATSVEDACAAALNQFFAHREGIR